MSKIFLIELVVLLKCHGCRAHNTVQWDVLGKINKYGDNLTLACTASDKTLLSPSMTLSWHMEQKLCATDNIPSDAAKYEPWVVPSEGGYLKIINFGQEDINKTYSCTIDFLMSEKELSIDAVFNDKGNALKPAKDKDRLSRSDLAVISLAVSCILFVVCALLCMWKRDQIIHFCNREQTAEEEPYVELQPVLLQDQRNTQGTSETYDYTSLLDNPVERDSGIQTTQNSSFCSYHVEVDAMNERERCLADNDEETQMSKSGNTSS